MNASSSPQPMVVGETNVNSNSSPTYASTINGNQLEKSLKPVILLHGEPTVVFDSKDLECFIAEENLRYALIAKFSHGRPELPDLRKILPQQLGFKGECNIGLLESRHVLLRFTLKEDYIAIFSKTSRSIKFAGNTISFRIQKWTPSFNPREETSIAMAWISFPSLPCQYFARNALFSMASAVGRPLDVDRATYDKTRPSTARVKVEVDLLRTLPKRIRVQFKDLITGEITNIWQRVKYDYLPYYCKRCKHQGHKEVDCRTLIDCQVDVTVNEDHIEGTKFQGDLRDHLNAKKIDLNTMEIDEEANDGMVKNLHVRAGSSGTQEQDLVHQNDEKSEQHMDKAVSQDCTSGNQTSKLLQQEKLTSSPSKQSGNLANHIGEVEELVDDTNQQTHLSKDAQPESCQITENGDLQLLTSTDLQPENFSSDENATENWNTIAKKKSISLQIDSSTGRSKSPSLEKRRQVMTTSANQSNATYDVASVNSFEVLRGEKEMQLVDSNPVKDQTLVPIQEVPSQRLDSLDEHQDKSGQLLPSIGNDKDVKGMASLSQANCTNDFINLKEKQGQRGAFKWGDLVDEEEPILTPSLNSKLSPQALEFVPKSVIAKRNEQEALKSGFSPTSNDCAIHDLGDDFSDEEEELDMCFDNVAREGDISPRHQRSGSNKIKKKKAHRRQHSWDGKVTEKFVPRHLPMRLAKQNHMTVSIGSNKSKKK